MLDLGDAEQGGDDPRRLVEPNHGAINGLRQFFPGGADAPRAFQLRAHPRKRRAQIMGDVVADVVQLIQQPFQFAQHMVHADRKLVEVVAAVACRQAFRQLAAAHAVENEPAST